MKNEICIGMAGAGRATELHIKCFKKGLRVFHSDLK